MKVLIIYYSKTGTTEQVSLDLKKKFLERAKDPKTEVVLERIEDTKKRGGFWGSLLSGYEAFKRKTTKIHSPRSNMKDYELVCIGTPVWAGNMAPAVRTLLQDYRKEMHRVAFFCSEGSSGGEKTLKEMELLLKRSPLAKLIVTQKEVQKQSESYQSKLDLFVKNASL